MSEEAPSPETTLAHFNRLIREVLRGQMNRNTFQPWEVELLLDIESCNLREASKEGTLRRYQRAVQRQLERGAAAPMMLSDFLKRKS